MNISIRLLCPHEVTEEFVKLLDNIASTGVSEEQAKVIATRRDMYGFITYIAVDDDTSKMIGTISTFSMPDFFSMGSRLGLLTNLAVSEEYRNKGVASKLLDHCVADLMDQSNCYKVLINCDKSLIKFFEKFGFTSCGEAMSISFDAYKERMK